MNYYYDVLLNFQEKYFMFYEWDEQDILEYAKKIPLYQVESQMLSDAISNILKVDEEFLKQLENKTKIKPNKFLNYACIISDGKNSMALEFNKFGVIINKSSLSIEDELNINEFIYSISKTNIKYEIIEKCQITKETRQELRIKKILKLEIEDLYNKKNYSKLKYLYLEWFDEILTSIEEMYNNMLNKIKGKISDREYQIYKIIKMSYKNV